MRFSRIIKVKGVSNFMAITQTVSNHQLQHWIKRIGQGDRDALEKLYHATGTAVYAYALSIVKNPQDAEDVLQDCYVAIFRSAGSYRPQDKPMAWIITIAKNLCLKLLRRQQRYTCLDSTELFPQLEADPTDKLMLQSCMKVLTTEEQQIVILHAVAGCTHRQIGQILSLKHGTVLSKYHRAIRKLRSCMREEAHL